MNPGPPAAVEELVFYSQLTGDRVLRPSDGWLRKPAWIGESCAAWFADCSDVSCVEMVVSTLLAITTHTTRSKRRFASGAQFPESMLPPIQLLLTLPWLASHQHPFPLSVL